MESQPYLDFARSRRACWCTGGWGVGADMIGWLSGLTNMIMLTRRQPEFIRALLELIAAWNRARMQVVLSAGVDLYIKTRLVRELRLLDPRRPGRSSFNPS